MTAVKENDMGEQPTREAPDPITAPLIASRAADISVRTTERGLPLQLRIGAREMSRAPEDLAREILALCQLSALRLQVARRRDLVARGCSPAVIRGLSLACEEELAEAERAAQGDDEGPPESWMTSR
jgi:hypothetical protein